jgi:hypothetical protein
MAAISEPTVVTDSAIHLYAGFFINAFFCHLHQE